MEVGDNPQALAALLPEKNLWFPSDGPGGTRIWSERFEKFFFAHARIRNSDLQDRSLVTVLDTLPIHTLTHTQTHKYIHRVIQNDCRCFNNLSYTIHMR